MFTVKQLSKIAGITPRTLRYYDRIGLLKPSRVGTNGYRYYDGQALLKLQQILLYRELDLPLERISEILHRPGFDLAGCAGESQARTGTAPCPPRAFDQHGGRYDFAFERKKGNER